MARTSAQTLKRSVSTTVPVDPAKDLTGKRFGKWLVLGFAGRVRYWCGRKRYSKLLWLCRCDCGTERHIPRSDLVHNRRTQCRRCAARRYLPLDPQRDLTGKRFGKWLVLGYVRKEVRRGNGTIALRMWLCRCDCGTERAISRGNLVHKYSTQCKRCANLPIRRPKTKLDRTWDTLKKSKLLSPEWLAFDAFRAAVGDPPDERAHLVRIDFRQLHGPGNSLWRWHGSEDQVQQARQESREQAVRKIGILTKIRQAKTRNGMRRYAIQARNAGYTYALIGIAAGMTRQGAQYLIDHPAKRDRK